MHSISEGPPPSRAFAKRGLRRAKHDVGVVAVDDDALEAVARRAVGGGMLDRRHLADRRVFHVEVVLADEDDGQLPDGGEIERLVECADVGGAVAEEADRDILFAEILRAPGRAAGDRQMRADDGVGAEHVVLDRGQMHRAALAAHEPDVAQHQLAEHAFHRGAARQGVSVSAIGAEGFVALAHGDAKSRRDGLLPERKMARALDQVLQEEIVGALLAIANFDLKAKQLQPLFDADVVVARRFDRAAALCSDAISQLPTHLLYGATLPHRRGAANRKHSQNEYCPVTRRRSDI